MNIKDLLFKNMHRKGYTPNKPLYFYVTYDIIAVRPCFLLQNTIFFCIITTSALTHLTQNWMPLCIAMETKTDSESSFSATKHYFPTKSAPSSMHFRSESNISIYFHENYNEYREHKDTVG